MEVRALSGAVIFCTAEGKGEKESLGGNRKWDMQVSDTVVPVCPWARLAAIEAVTQVRSP